MLCVNFQEVLVTYTEDVFFFSCKWLWITFVIKFGNAFFFLNIIWIL